MNLIYTIGSFNCCKLDRSKTGIDDIKQMILSEHFDVIALQEVLSEGVMNDLVNKLGPQKWKYCFKQTNITASKQAQKEGYAYLWNTNKFKLVEAGNAISIEDRYKIKRNQDGLFIHNHSLVRPPLVIRLTPQGTIGGCFFELRLINTHIIHDNLKNSTMAENNLSGPAVRKMELDILAKEIYRTVSASHYGNNWPVYTFLLGDYNLCLANGKYIMDEEIDMQDGRTLLSVQKEKTTVSKPPNQGMPDPSNVTIHENYANDYDHFSYDIDYRSKMSLVPIRVDGIRDYAQGDRERYLSRISDHVPIKLELNLRTR